MNNGDTEGTIHVTYALQPSGYPKRRGPHCNIFIVGHQLRTLINTGVYINIIAQDILKTVPFQPVLLPTSTQVFTYGSSTLLPLVGVFTTEIQHESQSTHAKVYVTKDGPRRLLSV
ncbi:hypothetical protein NDU88_001205 [Pleurodeles waltl]|uniref:Uncharacterized protein n=1 Tax=Pleurodeles waltl TaxID=8319 RepID=A0AAV7W0S7_PLEWA|nr:hypothetical protein NDU88_001205 [Pleurodeles waltl]